MSNDRTSYAGPYPTPESLGIDRGYEAERTAAKKELQSTMAGPRNPLNGIQAEGVKDPDGEFAVPARMTSLTKEGSPIDKARDPQGQQGGTEGGQPGEPKAGAAGRIEGTPLAAADERQNRSTQRSGAGVDEKF